MGKIFLVVWGSRASEVEFCADDNECGGPDGPPRKEARQICLDNPEHDRMHKGGDENTRTWRKSDDHARNQQEKESRQRDRIHLSSLRRKNFQRKREYQ